MKSKKQRANLKSYMTKALRKAIMKRSELLNIIRLKALKITIITRNKEIFAQSFIRKRGKNFMTIWTLKTL